MTKRLEMQVVQVAKSVQLVHVAGQVTHELPLRKAPAVQAPQLITPPL
jgi:hypothetical protein